DIRIDNVNIDLTHDVQRALPAAIVKFGRDQKFPGATARMVEHDVMREDPGYIPYLVVSALALDAMVIAGILGAMATAREWERRTVKLLRLSPASPGILLAGKLTVAGTVAGVVRGRRARGGGARAPRHAGADLDRHAGAGRGLHRGGGVDPRTAGEGRLDEPRSGRCTLATCPRSPLVTGRRS